MSGATGLPAKPEKPRGDTPMRHFLSICSVFATYWGVTVTLELLKVMATHGNCGYRFGPACQQGQEYLALGPAAFIAGIFLSGKLSKREGWQGPLIAFDATSLIYGSGGSAVAFGTGLIQSESVSWSITVSVFGLLSLGVFVFLVHGFLTGHSGSITEKLRSLFWVLEDLPSQKGKRKRVVRERGIAPERAEGGVLYPETSTERAFWRLFMLESCMAVIAGCVVGRIFIHLIAG
ncbi:hypothetical protein ACIQVO_25275 [Streptomyces sp. NPDC101062]|uniref:hypothetical protein n=1 Tax=unclassified Streptomyces TaxID=2593676 RepID=UPI0038284C64